MPTQRITLAKIGGVAAAHVERRFATWLALRQGDDWPALARQEFDQFAEALRANAAFPPIVYFSEWIDMWSGGDLVPTLRRPLKLGIRGDRYEACCHRVPVKLGGLTSAPQKAQEATWLIARVDEANAAWSDLVDDSVIVILREVLAPLVEDEELESSLGMVPSWLSGNIAGDWHG